MGIRLSQLILSGLNGVNHNCDGQSFGDGPEYCNLKIADRDCDRNRFNNKSQRVCGPERALSAGY